MGLLVILLAPQGRMSGADEWESPLLRNHEVVHYVFTWTNRVLTTADLSDEIIH